MSTYRKRPVTVTAHQWHQNGDHPDDGVGDWTLEPIGGEPFQRIEGLVVRFWRDPDVPGTSPCRSCGHTMHAHGWIDTLEYGHTVCPGDWIITGIQGERYPVKDHIFRETYEPVDGAA